VVDAKLPQEVFQIGRKIREDAEAFATRAECGQRGDYIIEQRFKFAALKTFADFSYSARHITPHAEPTKAISVKFIPETYAIIAFQTQYITKLDLNICDKSA
jgi:hypothetical protein